MTESEKQQNYENFVRDLVYDKASPYLQDMERAIRAAYIKALDDILEATKEEPNSYFIARVEELKRYTVPCVHDFTGRDDKNFTICKKCGESYT